MTNTAFHARTDQARRVIIEHNLGNLLDKHREAIEEYMEARRQYAEAKRTLQDAVDNRATAELDALLEMEQDPDYVPGKNAEQRKQQAEAWLAKHPAMQATKRRERTHRLAVDEAALVADHARARIDHLELQIAARRTELDLIASFARGAS